jgi:DNA-binding transcriptional ArsR family regulator
VDSSIIIETKIIDISERLSALADPVRVTILGVLSSGQQCVCELQERVPIASNLLSYHLRVLRDAGLVVATRRGRWMDYRIDEDGFSRLWTSAGSVGLPVAPASARRRVRAS